MNKKKFQYIYLLLFIILFTACEEMMIKEIEIDDYPIGRRLVFNSIIKAECDSNFLYFYNSYSFFDPLTSRKFIKDPTGTYWYPEDVKPLNKVGVHINGNLLTETDKYYLGKDSIMYFKEKFYPGDEIFIEADNEGRKIKAKTTIPQKPIILSVDTVHFIEKDIYDNKFYKRLRLFIKMQEGKNPEGEYDYYQIFTSNDIITEYAPEYVAPGYPTIQTLMYPYFYTSDPLLVEGDDSDLGLIEGSNLIPHSNNSFNTFSSESFVNGKYTLNLYMEDFSDSYSWEDDRILSRKYRVRVLLIGLTKEYYLYLNSLGKSYDNESKIEPVQLFNNIEGGLGILGGVSELEYVVFEKDLPLPPTN